MTQRHPPENPSILFHFNHPFTDPTEYSRPTDYKARAYMMKPRMPTVDAPICTLLTAAPEEPAGEAEPEGEPEPAGSMLARTVA